jgi:arylformamidase
MGKETKNTPDRFGRLLRLSYTLETDSPVHIGLKKLKITPANQISYGDDYNTYKITVENHCGTHVDAPAHFLEGGRKISEYQPEELLFRNPLILNCLKNPGELIDTNDVSKIELKHYDCIFIRTGFDKYRSSNLKTYLTLNPGISSGAVDYLRKNFPHLACLGIESISISRFGHKKEAIETHQTAFSENKDYGKPLLLVEDLNFKSISGEEITEVLLVPWQVGGIDSAPCSVLARIKNK